MGCIVIGLMAAWAGSPGCGVVAHHVFADGRWISASHVARLHGNVITDVGAGSIADALKHNITLTHLW